MTDETYATVDSEQKRQLLQKMLWRKAKRRRSFVIGALAISTPILAWVLWETFKADNLGFANRTLWDWLELLIVPIILAIIGVLFSKAQRDTELLIAERRQIEDQQRAEERAQVERELAEENRQQAALDAYFDRMSGLLIDKNVLSSSEDSAERSIARTWTLTILRSLNASRKSQVLQFLYESRLIGYLNPSGYLHKPVIDMSSADLREINLEYAKLDVVSLPKANLRSANLHSASLIGANFHMADMDDIDLGWADLREADLRAGLKRANLGVARLDGANLESAHLSGAMLINARLVNANLRNANLKYIDPFGLPGGDVLKADLALADLTGADLTNAKVDDDQLLNVRSLKGAKMPDGTVFEEWIRLRKKVSKSG